MAQIIDGIPYPSSWHELKKDAKLMKVFAVYAKKAQIVENVMFLLRKKNVNKDFITFIQPKSMYEINISHGLRKQFLDIIRNTPKSWDPKSDRMIPIVKWDDPAWQGLFDEAEKEIRNLIDQHHLKQGMDSFWKSKEFQAYHAKFTKKELPQAAPVENVTPVDWKKLQLVGFEDPKSKDIRLNMGRMIAALGANDMRAAKKALKQAQRWEKTGTFAETASFEVMVKRLKKYKLVA